MKARDTQRQKLYNAERACFEPHGISVPFPRAVERYETMHELEQVVDSIVTSKWWCDRYGYRYGDPYRAKHFHIADGRGTRIARGGGYFLNFPKWSRKRWVVLHELSHILTQRLHPPEQVAWASEATWPDSTVTPADHGWQFASVFLAMVGRFIGADAAKALKTAFRKHHVRFAPKRKRVMSEEAKAAFRERLAVARAARRKQ